MPQFYVYVYRDPSRRNEPIYVGKGQGRRAYKHLTRKDKHPFTQRLQLMKRNGIEPDIQILPCESEEFALLAEEEAIDRFGRKDLGRGTLLNLTDGGEGSSNPSPETRKKQSDANKGKPSPNKGKTASLETRKKQSDANKGKTRTPEHCQKLSAAHKGKTITPEARQKNSDAHKGKIKPKSICPHCGRLSGPSRYHFDKCKSRK